MYNRIVEGTSLKNRDEQTGPGWVRTSEKVCLAVNSNLMRFIVVKSTTIKNFRLGILTLSVKALRASRQCYIWVLGLLVKFGSNQTFWRKFANFSRVRSSPLRNIRKTASMHSCHPLQIVGVQLQRPILRMKRLLYWFLPATGCAWTYHAIHGTARRLHSSERGCVAVIWTLGGQE